MKYSIIVPIYNIEIYLPECIDSVLQQSFTDWELILVDDGSPDKCPAICDKYAAIDERIKVVHKNNGGLVSARKAGLEVATGDYAICLDGDDFLHRSCLNKIDEQVAAYHPDIICHGYVKYFKDKQIDVPFSRYRIGYYDRSALESEILPRLLYTPEGFYFQRMVWSKAFKMDLYRKFQMAVSSEISMGEDGACTYPLICQAQSMVIMSDCLHYYRQIETSMTKVRKPLEWENYDRLYNHYETTMPLEKYGLRKQMYRARTHNLFNICMSQFYAGKGYAETVKELRERFKAHNDYDVALNGASFTSLRLLFCKYVLKFRLYPILQIYANHKDLLKRGGYKNTKNALLTKEEKATPSFYLLIYKSFINLRPAIRGYLKYMQSLFRSGVYFHKGTRIKRAVEWKLFPGCLFEGGKGLIVGKDVTINVSKGASLIFGNKVGIGNRCQIVSHESITIGEGSILGPGVMVFDHNHVFDFQEGVRQREFESSAVIIGNHCWLGAGVIVLKGVSIGDNCVIGAGAVVTKDIPSNSVAVGNPAKVIMPPKEV